MRTENGFNDGFSSKIQCSKSSLRLFPSVDNQREALEENGPPERRMTGHGGARVLSFMEILAGSVHCDVTNNSDWLRNVWP